MHSTTTHTFWSNLFFPNRRKRKRRRRRKKHLECVDTKGKNKNKFKNIYIYKSGNLYETLMSSIWMTFLSQVSFHEKRRKPKFRVDIWSASVDMDFDHCVKISKNYKKLKSTPFLSYLWNGSTDFKHPYIVGKITDGAKQIIIIIILFC